MKPISSLPALLLGALLLTGCNNSSTDNASDGIGSKISANIESEINKAKTEFEKEKKDIEVRLMDGKEALISANGDLTIAGEKIELSQAQRDLTLQYYATTREMAMQGMEIGKESAKLATAAIGSALEGAFNGTSEKKIEAEVEAKSGSIKAAANRLCQSALSLKDTQQKLSAELPAFNAEPIEVDVKKDGCRVSSSNINSTVNSKDMFEAPEAPEAPQPPEPPAI